MFDASPRPELLALLAAVKAEPDDDTAKLALADWLEEQDGEHDRARGEYLRAAVRHHRADPADPARADDLVGLVTRWQHHHAAWVGPLLDAGFYFWGSASRAWLLAPTIDGTQVVATKAVAVAGTEAYAWVGGLSFNRLTDAQFRTFLASPLPDSLIGLSLDGCNTTPAALEALAASPKAAGLKSLDLTRVEVSGSVLGGSPHLAGLRTLRVSEAALGDAGFKALCDSPHLDALRALAVSAGGLTIHAAPAFADAAGLPALADLDLHNNRVGPDAPLILAASPTAARLRRLNLADNGIADDGVEALCRQAHVAGLTHLDVSHNQLSNRAAVALAAAPHLGSLDELILRGNGISGAGGIALANSLHLANLRRLDLVGNPVGEKGAARLRERFGTRVVLDKPGDRP